MKKTNSRAIMLQGTGSDVGKSVLTAALCRAVKRRGFTVAPFKPQNMSNNAAACPAGGEIGRAQALQALAAGIDPHVDMNPVLLKPETDQMAQVVLQGKPLNTMEAKHYMESRDQLMEAVMDSFQRLSSQYDYVIVEGAGSPAEVNLRDRDIANMGFARRANVPVCLVGDIDKGGVIASLVGTQTVISPEDQAMIKGFIVNKFRGDPELFEDGVRFIENRTSWPCFGVVPWLKELALLPAEDAVTFQKPRPKSEGVIKISAPMFSRIANFDDADPLKMEASVDFNWIPPGQAIPKDTDVIILFGTKSTLGDLEFMRAQGWDHDIIAHARHGGHVLGICGGYQMLGKTIRDPQGFDGLQGEAKGLGLLDVETIMTDKKKVLPVSGYSPTQQTKLEAYEIHTGRTEGPDTRQPFAIIDDTPEGAFCANGRISGTYLHGVFTNDAFRRAWLSNLGAHSVTKMNYNQTLDNVLDKLADHIENALDVDVLLEIKPA